MKTKKEPISENYLQRIPLPANHLDWKKEEDGKVTLMIENKGTMNRLTQMLLKKPKISYIHLDDMGSFVWPLMDGKKDIIALGEPVKEHFKEAAEPLYPRLAEFFRVLDSYGFVQWVNEETDKN